MTWFRGVWWCCGQRLTLFHHFFSIFSSVGHKPDQMDGSSLVNHHSRPWLTRLTSTRLTRMPRDCQEITCTGDGEVLALQRLGRCKFRYKVCTLSVNGVHSDCVVAYTRPFSVVTTISTIITSPFYRIMPSRLDLPANHRATRFATL